jgi:hypothetical protein
VANRFGFGIQNPKADPVAIVVETCHQLQSRVGAKRLRVCVLEAKPFRSELVNVRRFVARAAITPNAFDPNIVGHDQDDIRWTLIGGNVAVNREHCESDQQAKRDFAGETRFVEVNVEAGHVEQRHGSLFSK